jgi:hypothetical protein
LLTRQSSTRKRDLAFVTATLHPKKPEKNKMRSRLARLHAFVLFLLSSEGVLFVGMSKRQSEDGEQGPRSTAIVKRSKGDENDGGAKNPTSKAIVSSSTGSIIAVVGRITKKKKKKKKS